MIDEDLKEKARECYLKVEEEHDAEYRTDLIATALQSVRDAERERAADKIDGLESDLSNAVETAIKRGAVEWGRLNYPNHPTLAGSGGKETET